MLVGHRDTLKRGQSPPFSENKHEWQREFSLVRFIIHAGEGCAKLVKPIRSATKANPFSPLGGDIPTRSVCWFSGNDCRYVGRTVA